MFLERGKKFDYFNKVNISLFSDDEDNMDEDEEKIAVAATFGISAVFKNPRSPAKGLASGAMGGVAAAERGVARIGKEVLGPSQQNVDRERLTVDITALKKQYSKLRQRQKQAQIILTSEYSLKKKLILAI